MFLFALFAHLILFVLSDIWRIFLSIFRLSLFVFISLFLIQCALYTQHSTARVCVLFVGPNEFLILQMKRFI